MKMKVFFTVLCILCSVLASAQTATISMKDSKVTQLIFPNIIKSFKGGFLPSDFAISTEGNVVYIQPLGEFVQSNLNIVTEDGHYYTFIVKYDVDVNMFNHIITSEQAIYRDGNSRSSREQDNKAGIDKRAESGHDIVCRNILQQKGYLFTRNIVKIKNFSMILKGVYIDQDNMYLRIQLENDSNIKYDIDALTFYVETVIKGKTTTQEKTQFIPVYVYNDVQTINTKSSLELICCFDKFTINDKKALFISIIEKEGERNLNLEVHNSIILEARKYE